jgi:predicted permease
LLTTLLAGLVLPALLLTTLARFLAALLATLVMLATLLLLVVLVWIAHWFFLLVIFPSGQQVEGAVVPECHLTHSSAVGFLFAIPTL